MSFLKGIFGKDKDEKKTPPAKPGISAPPARPFPAGFSAENQMQGAHAQQYAQQQQQQQQHYHPSQYPQQHEGMVMQQHQQQPSMGGGGGDMFDLFDGLSVKVPDAGAPAEPAVDQQAAAGGGGGDDMFSGMNMSSSTAAPEGELAGGSGGSLLSMLNSEGANAEEEAHAGNGGEASSFSFVSETSGGAEEPAHAEGGSSFSFMSSSAAAADTPQSQPAPVVTPTTTYSTTPAAATSASRGSFSTPAASPSSVVAHTTPTAVATPTSATNASLTSAPRKSLSAAPTFEQIHSQIDESLSSYWDKLKNLNLTQSALRTQQIELQGRVKQAHDEIAALEIAQQREIEAENYEGADQLNSQLDALKASLAQTHKDLEVSAKNIADQESAKTQLKKNTKDVLEDCIKHYTSLTKQYTFQMTNSITTETQALEQKEDIVITNLEKVRRNLTHTKSDLATIAAEEEKITEQMSVDTKEMNEEHHALQSQLSTLEAEREELRKLLAAKDEEVAMCAQKIDVVTTKISAKRSAHEKKLSRAAEKKSRMEAEQSQALKEEEDLLAAKAALEMDFKNVANREKNSTRKLKKMQEEVSYIQNVVMNKLEKQKKEASGSASTSPSSASAAVAEPTASPSSELAELQRNLSETLSDLEGSRFSLANLETSIDSINKQLESVNARIPALEAEKNLAVATRDFKKAAAASKDVKQLQTDKAGFETQLSELRTQGTDLNQKLSALTEKKSSLSSQMVALESEADKKLLLGFLKQRLELSHLSLQVQSLQKKNQQEKNEEQEGANGAVMASPSSHHFAYLPHEIGCYAVEEELLTKEVEQLRRKHAWGDDFLDGQAREEVKHERKERGEVDEEDEAAAVKEEEESSISEQRRKERNAAIAAQQAAAEAEASGAASTSEEAQPATSGPSSPVMDAANALDESTAPASAEEIVAPVESPVDAVEPSPVESAEVTGEAESSVAAVESPVADTTPATEPEVEPAPIEPVPAGPTEEERAAFHSKYASLQAEIPELEAQLQAVVESEEFEEAERLDGVVNDKKKQLADLAEEAVKLGIEL